MNDPEQYKLQRFPNLHTKSETFENDLQYETRLYWMNNDYPSYDDVDVQLGRGTNYTKMTAWRYGWTDIKEHYKNLIEAKKNEHVIQRRKEREFEYNEYIDDQLKKNKDNSNLYDNATKFAFMGIGVINPPAGVELPEAFQDIDFCKFIITNSPKAKKIYHDLMLRDLEQPEKIKTEKDNDPTLQKLEEVFDDETMRFIIDDNYSP